MNYIPAIEFGTQEQINNLQKLLDFLKSSEAKTSFNMRSFSVTKHKVYPSPSKVENECGTVCCLAGHGPLAGVAPLEEERWINYIDRVFTSNFDIFTFLFDSDWHTYMPTKEQAIFRLELFLKKGLPENFKEDSYLEISEHRSFANECFRGLHTLD